jgi:hypothetical protein
MQVIDNEHMEDKNEGFDSLRTAGAGDMSVCRCLGREGKHTVGRGRVASLEEWVSSSTTQRNVRGR